MMDDPTCSRSRGHTTDRRCRCRFSATSASATSRFRRFSTGDAEAGLYNLNGTHPFRKARLKILAPEEDRSVYYGRFKPAALGMVFPATQAFVSRCSRPIRTPTAESPTTKRLPNSVKTTAAPSTAHGTGPMVNRWFSSSRSRRRSSFSVFRPVSSPQSVPESRSQLGPHPPSTLEAPVNTGHAHPRPRMKSRRSKHPGRRRDQSPSPLGRAGLLS